MIVTEDQIREEILETIQRNRIMLFMKGTPDAPRCGFSARSVQCLDAAGAEFAAMDILPDPRIRQQLSALFRLADDPAALHRRRAGRRLRHHQRALRDRRAGKMVAPAA